MRKISKRFLVVLCTLLMALSISGCGKEKEIIEYDEARLVEYGEQIVGNLQMLSPEMLKMYEAQMSEEEFSMWTSALESYSAAADEIGVMKFVDASATADDKIVTLLINVTGESGKSAQIEVLLDKKMSFKSITTNVNRSFGENMTNAGLNTLLGMGTVFTVLIFICFIISSFGFIAAIEKKMKAPKQEDTKAKAVDSAVAQIIEQEELADDLELVAVISAAIAAFEESNGGSGDGYVVRSIKRRA